MVQERLLLQNCPRFKEKKMKRRLLAGMISCMLALCIVPASAYAQNNRGVARAGATYRETVAGAKGKASLVYYVFIIDGATADSVTARVEANVTGTLTARATIIGKSSTKTKGPAKTTGLSCAVTVTGENNAVTGRGDYSYTSNGYGSVSNRLVSASFN